MSVAPRASHAGTAVTATLPRPTRAGASGRLSSGALVAVGAAVVLLVIGATDQVVPATSSHQAELRIWLAARATGFMTLGLLTLQVVLGLVLSHPTNKATWKLSKRLFPWHEHLWVFTLAFLAVHVVSLAADEYADVGVLGALVPGLSEYRTAPVALGTLSLYALLVTGATARWIRMLPAGAWLSLHRISLVVLILAWMHGLLAGTDSVQAASVYGASFGLVVAAAAYRYWVSRAGRPSFATSLPEAER